MNALFEAAKEVCEFMTAHRWEFCVIGGLAVQRWGEPRTTLDAESIVIRMPRLNSEHILTHLADLCELKEAPEIVERARRLIAEHP